MRIGVDARLAGYRQAGISRYTTSLLEALVARYPGDHFTVLVARNSRWAPGPTGNARYRPVLTPPHHRFEHLTLPLEVAPLRLHLYHGTDFAAPRLPAHVAIVVTVHDLYFLRDPTVLDGPSTRYYHHARGRLKHADAIIAVSRQTRADVEHLADVDMDRVHVVYEAADPRYRPMSPTERAEAVTNLAPPLPPAVSRLLGGELDPYILFVGTIEPRKNLLMLLGAYRQYRAHAGAGSARLVLAGARGWRDGGELAEIARCSERDDVTWLGPVADELLPLLYNGASAVVVPSRYEGFGLTALEALACGVPVLASNVASLPEVVGEAGLLVPPGDRAAWAGALHHVLGDCTVNRYLREAGPRQAARFSWSRAASETMGVYRTAVQRRVARLGTGAVA